MPEGMWFIVGVVLGGVIAGAIALWRRSRLIREVSDARSRAEMLDRQAAELLRETAAVREELRETAHRREHAERSAAVLEAQLRSREERLEEERKLREEMEQRLKDTFRTLGSDALRINNEQFITLARKTFDTLLSEAKGDVEKKQQAIDALVKPIRELLERHNLAVGELEKKREVAYTRLEQHLEFIARSHEKLGTETSRLVSALRRPEQRGRWGEIQLRNVVELAGMTEHCDFREQVQTDDAETRDRPDMVVNLPGGGLIVVDSKVSLDAYLNSIDPDNDRTAELQRHSRQVEQHVRQLSSKAYWNQFARTPRIVVMFMPLESALHAALDVRPDLHAEAMKQHVLIATPTLLVAMLRAIAYGWQQEAIAQNARDIAEVGRELYDRLSVFASHFERVGRGLEGATRSYNQAIGSLESRVLVSARRLRELRATAAAEIAPPDPIELDVRDITAGELRPLPGDHEPEDIED